METQIARWPTYYGELTIKVLSPKWYYPKNRGKIQDSYSEKIVEGKHKDLSGFFFEDIKSVFDSLTEKPSCIVVVPASKPGSFSPTMIGLGKKLSEYAHIPNKNIIHLKIQREKKTRCVSADQRYTSTKNAYNLIRPLNNSGIVALLLDDTKATGITLLECKRILMEAGAKDVVAICLGINAPPEQ